MTLGFSAEGDQNTEDLRKRFLVFRVRVSAWDIAWIFILPREPHLQTTRIVGMRSLHGLGTLVLLDWANHQTAVQSPFLPLFYPFRDGEPLRYDPVIPADEFCGGWRELI